MIGIHFVKQCVDLDAELQLRVAAAKQLLETGNGNLRTRWPASGVIDQQTAHCSRCDRKEMLTILPVSLTRLDETKIDFVHQGGGLERVIRPLTSHQTPGKHMQVRQDECEQTLL